MTVVDILFSSLGGYGHTFPLIPLARAAADAGHDVHWATTSSMLPTLAAAGFETHVAGITIRDAFATLGRTGPAAGAGAPTHDAMDHVLQCFREVLPNAFVADLVPIIDHVRPGVVVAEAGNIGAMQAAAAAGVGCIRHGLGRGITFGWDAPELVHLDIYPPSLQDPDVMALPRYAQLRPVAFAPAGDLPEIVVRDDGRPLVYVTLGTEFGSIVVLDAIIGALDTGEARVLVAAGPSVDRSALRPISEHVEIADWVPQAAVLPYVSVVVHHGGSGTTLAVMAAGIGQLVLPQGADQFRNGDAVVAGGLGEQLLGDAATPDAIASSVARLLDPAASVHRAAAMTAAEIGSMPSPADVAAELASFSAFPR